MTILQKLINAWKAEDYLETAACFVPDDRAVFVDYAPALVGQEPVHLYGDRTIEMYFRNVFYPMNRMFRIAEEKILSESEANYFAFYRGRYLFVRRSLEETDADGRILRAVDGPE